MNSITRFRELRNRVWESPVIMTWGSFLVKALNYTLLLPLILNRFEQSEVVIWFVFQTIFALQLVADLGFSQSFSRVFSYALAGVKKIELKIRGKGETLGKPNWELMQELYTSSKFIYRAIGLLSFILLLTLGTWSVYKPINEIPFLEQNYYWIAWAFLVVTMPLILIGNLYSSYLVGTNHIALVKKWDTATTSFLLLTNIIILLLNGGLVLLVFNNQFWLLSTTIRNYYLVKQVTKGKFEVYKKAKLNKEVFQSIWPSSWRSALAILLSYGLTQLSGIVFAQIGEQGEVASYLLALKVVQAIQDFSSAPFYTKLPTLNILRSQNKIKELFSVSKRGMQLSYLTFTFGFFFVAILNKPLLTLIGSNTVFVPINFWLLMGIGKLFERYGAMHLQVYSTTNHIVWHITNSVSGILFIILCIGGYSIIGYYIFPIAHLISYISFYSWYSPMLSYNSLSISFFQYEKTAFIPILVIFLLASLGLRYFEYIQLL